MFKSNPFHRQPKPEEALGPDGMTDFAREMKRQREVRDRALAEIHERIAERTGIDAELIQHLPAEYLTAALILGIKVGE